MPRRKRTIRKTADALWNRYAGLSPKHRRSLKIYIESLMQRFTSMEWALEQIDALARASAATTESFAPFEKFRQKQDFYTDAFWAFGYSMFDITAHVMNTIHRLEDDESQVSFAHAMGTLSPTYTGTKPSYSAALNRRLKAIGASRVFKRLKGYRQCCLHRRAVAVWDDRTTGDVTSMYSDGTSKTTIIESTICDEVNDLSPKFTKGRRLQKECNDIRNFIEKNVGAILASL